MNDYERLVVFFFGLGALALFIKSILEITQKKNPYGKFDLGIIYGGFVYADYMVFCAFWVTASFTIILLNDFLLFLLVYSVFWLVRSIGEALYWFLQQFSTLVHKNPPQRFFLYRYVKSDAIWFVNQIYWQCLTVVFTVTTIYLAHLWLSKIM